MAADADVYKPSHHIRVITATSLFDGHDVAINIIRRILQDTGVEVIHLGHNRSVQEIVDAAIEEDAQGVAVSCYQGGHIEFFKYIIDLLKETIREGKEIYRAEIKKKLLTKGYRSAFPAMLSQASKLVYGDLKKILSERSLQEGNEDDTISR